MMPSRTEAIDPKGVITMAESKQRKPPPIVVRTLVPREAPSPEDVLRKFLERAELDRWRHTRSKHSH